MVLEFQGKTPPFCSSGRPFARRVSQLQEAMEPAPHQDTRKARLWSLTGAETEGSPLNGISKGDFSIDPSMTTYVYALSSEMSFKYSLRYTPFLMSCTDFYYFLPKLFHTSYCSSWGDVWMDLLCLHHPATKPRPATILSLVLQLPPIGFCDLLPVDSNTTADMQWCSH